LWLVNSLLFMFYHSKNRPSKSRETWPDVRERGKNLILSSLSNRRKWAKHRHSRGHIRGHIKVNVTTFDLIIIFPLSSVKREDRIRCFFLSLARRTTFKQCQTYSMLSLFLLCLCVLLPYALRFCMCHGLYHSSLFHT